MNVSLIPSAELRLFISLLLLEVEGANVTLSFNSAARSRFSRRAHNPLMSILNLVGRAVSIENQELRFGPLILEDTFGTAQTLGLPIARHFKQQALREGYKMLGLSFLTGPEMASAARSTLANAINEASRAATVNEAGAITAK
jgi:hypothetical protein